jgi:NAD-dependent SIR2 family protein deacetylase
MTHTTTCTKCSTSYEESSEEQANAPERLCPSCTAYAAWYMSLRPELRPVVDRYGEELFRCCFSLCAAAEAVSIIQRNLDRIVFLMRTANMRTGIPACTSTFQATQVIVTALNGFSTRYVQFKEWTPAEIDECKRDLERAAQLVSATSNPSGGIIVAH